MVAWIGYVLLTRLGTRPNRWALVSFGLFFFGAFWFQAVMRGKLSFVRLEHGQVVAGRVRLDRAGLSTVLGRWVDAVRGTTKGSALILKQGTRSLTLGCRETKPIDGRSGLPATSGVTLVLTEADFQTFARKLGYDPVPAQSPKQGVLTVNLIPSSLSARGFWRNLVPLLVVGAVAEIVGVVGVFVLKLPEIVLASLSWVLAAGGLAGMLALARRPARPHQRLRIQSGDVAWLDGKRETVLAKCVLAELAVERRRFTLRTRFGTSVQLCLVLHFRGRRKLYFGLDEGSVEFDERFVPTRTAPALLVGRREWDALVKRLP